MTTTDGAAPVRTEGRMRITAVASVYALQGLGYAVVVTALPGF